MWRDATRACARRKGRGVGEGSERGASSVKREESFLRRRNKPNDIHENMRHVSIRTIVSYTVRQGGVTNDHYFKSDWDGLPL